MTEWHKHMAGIEVDAHVVDGQIRLDVTFIPHWHSVAPTVGEVHGAD